MSAIENKFIVLTQRDNASYSRSYSSLAVEECVPRRRSAPRTVSDSRTNTISLGGGRLQMSEQALAMPTSASSSRAASNQNPCSEMRWISRLTTGHEFASHMQSSSSWSQIVEAQKPDASGSAQKPSLPLGSERATQEPATSAFQLCCSTVHQPHGTQCAFFPLLSFGSRTHSCGRECGVSKSDAGSQPTRQRPEAGGGTNLHREALEAVGRIGTPRQLRANA